MNSRDIELKFIFLGTINTGKTSLTQRLQYGPLETLPRYSSTIGVDYCHYRTSFKDTNYKIHIWDAGGHDSFINVVRSFYNKVTGAIIVYDISNNNSFLKAQEYLDDFKKFCDYYHYVIILGNKCDLEREVEYEDGLKYAQSVGAFFMECSVKKNINMNNLFDNLIFKVDEDILTNKLIPNFYNGVKIFYNSKSLDNDLIVSLNNDANLKKCCIIS